jgi:CRISPR-associated protein Csb2
MLAISAELLTGRYTATSFNQWDVAEWPPHPARLFSALVAAWADVDEPDPIERDALLWLESQGPPALTCSDDAATAKRAPVDVYVPVNDARALRTDLSKSYERMANAEAQTQAAAESGDDRATALAARSLEQVRSKAAADARKAASASGPESGPVARAVLAVLPEHRAKQARRFPTVIPDDDLIWFSWPDAEASPEQRDILDRLCSRVGRLGHSSSLVSCRVQTAGVPAPTLVPSSDGTQPLRVPQAGLLDRLDEEFEVHQGREQRTLPAATAFYRKPTARRTVAPGPLLGGDWIVLGLPRRLEEPAGAAIAVTRSLDLARAVRGALLRHGDQPSPEVLTGHRERRPGEQGSPATDRPHLAIVPLPDVAHEHSDGVVHGVALVLPCDPTDADRAAVERALAGWTGANVREVRLGGAGGGVGLHLDPPRLHRATGSVVTGVEASVVEVDGRATIDRRFWCRPARHWVTATPIALDRFPGDLHAAVPEVRDAAREEAVGTIVKACGLAGFPQPADVAIAFDGFLRAVPGTGRRGTRRAGRRFPVFKAGTSGQTRMTVHARIEFEAPVTGPVLLGAGRFLGYGLCLPIDARAGRS